MTEQIFKFTNKYHLDNKHISEVYKVLKIRISMKYWMKKIIHQIEQNIDTNLYIQKYVRLGRQVMEVLIKHGI